MEDLEKNALTKFYQEKLKMRRNVIEFKSLMETTF
jgi:hypothetical protein